MRDRDEAMKADLGLYDYLPWPGRPKITWPNGARVAFWVAPNIEYYELDPPINPSRRAWARPFPDVVPYATRDYGNRVAHDRMMEVMDAHGVRGSVSLNVAVIDHHPEIIRQAMERDWEFYSHGIYNTRYCYNMSEAQERAIIEDSIKTVEDFTGQRIAGWLAPALTHNVWTMDLLAEYGLSYTCDLFHDDQPMPVNTKSGRFISIPYSLEMNDVITYNAMNMPPRRYGEILKRNFDRLRAEAIAQDTGVVMCIPLHAYLVGQPNRIAGLEDALAHITAHDDVWVTTGREIAQWYIEHHFDPVQAAIAEHRARYASRWQEAS